MDPKDNRRRFLKTTVATGIGLWADSSLRARHGSSAYGETVARPKDAGYQAMSRNLIVVISHDLGQHLGCYGAEDVRTPNLDAFAAGGLRFDGSFCAAPQCSPSRAALWTGRFPHANGVVGLTHGGFVNDLNPDERHLAQILGDAGYETHVFGAQHAARDPRRCGFQAIHGGGSCAKVASAVSEFLQRRGRAQKPLFLETAFFEPHRPFPHKGVEPLDPAALSVPPYLPDIPEVREDLAEMEASCCSADKAFGVIVEAVERCGMADDTIVVFTADHGIPFPHAKMTLYDPGIQVALLMRVPGVRGGKVHGELISNVDFVPTVLELLDLPVPKNVHGRSFKPLITGEVYKPTEAIFAEKTYHTYYDPMRAIRTEKWKLIANFENAPWQETPPDYHNNAKGYEEIATAKPYPQGYHPPLELYDLEADPWEQNNLADQKQYVSIRNELARRLRKWMQDTADPLLDGPVPQAAYKRRMEAFMGL